MRMLSVVAPELAASEAERRFFLPPRVALPADAAERLAGAERFELDVVGVRVIGWVIGPQGDAASGTAYLVHGWGGRGAQLLAIAEALASAGHRAVLFDAPGHGESEAGPTTLLHMATALRAVVERHGAGAVVAHSLGGVAAAHVLAATGTPPLGPVVLIGSPAQPRQGLMRFLGVVGLSPELRGVVAREVERRYLFRWEDVDVPRLARRLSERQMAGLLVHDREDREVPFEETLAIARAWPGARVLPTAGLGHRRILQDREVVAAIVSFLSGATDVGIEGAALHPEPARCARCGRPLGEPAETAEPQGAAGPAARVQAQGSSEASESPSLTAGTGTAADRDGAGTEQLCIECDLDVYLFERERRLAL